jgi:gamma-tubulin complex component 6
MLEQILFYIMVFFNNARYKYVSKLTIKLFEEGFGLLEHLLALRRYHFMELADWADLFIKSLWHHVFFSNDNFNAL